MSTLDTRLRDLLALPGVRHVELWGGDVLYGCIVVEAPEYWTNGSKTNGISAHADTLVELLATLGAKAAATHRSQPKPAWDHSKDETT